MDIWLIYSRHWQLADDTQSMDTKGNKSEIKYTARMYLGLLTNSTKTPNAVKSTIWVAARKTVCPYSSALIGSSNCTIRSFTTATLSKTESGIISVTIQI